MNKILQNLNFYFKINKGNLKNIMEDISWIDDIINNHQKSKNILLI